MILLPWNVNMWHGNDEIEKLRWIFSLIKKKLFCNTLNFFNRNLTSNNNSLIFSHIFFCSETIVCFKMNKIIFYLFLMMPLIFNPLVLHINGQSMSFSFLVLTWCYPSMYDILYIIWYLVASMIDYRNYALHWILIFIRKYIYTNT